MKLIYIAGPFRGANAWEVHQNCNRAEAMAFEVFELGAVALCPHNNTRNFDGTFDEPFWLEATLELMRRCDAVLVLPDSENSKGTKGEIAEATKLGIPVFRSLAELREWVGAHATQIDTWVCGECGWAP